METRDQVNPFPGLRPFEPDEDYLFFGRERETDELRRRLRTTRFLSVIGSSGSGKSSLVRSGLIPSLHSGFMANAGSSWRVAIVHPGEDAIGNLVVGLDSREVLGTNEDLAGTHRAMLEATLRGSSLGLAEAIRNARLPEADNVLIVMDQFEELFRFKRSKLTRNSSDEAVACVKLLLEASQQREVPVYVVLTMRSEFIGDCMAFPGLPDAMNQGQHLIPRMSRDELHTAITGPVTLSGAAIAPRLVTRLLNEVGDERDSLPVLQHALRRTWDDWHENHSDGEPMDLRHYEAIGTMKEALSRHADEAFHELNSGREKEIAEKLFKTITEIDDNGRGVRRPAPLQEITSISGASEAEVISVIDRFRTPGRTFLAPPSRETLHSGSIIDLSHESLMRLWTRLIAWTKEETRSAEIYRRLSRSAEQHEKGEASLWRNPELQIGVRWRRESRPTALWAQRYDKGFQRAMRFLDKSRRAHLLRRLSMAAMVLLLIGFLTWKVYDQQREILDLRTTVSQEQEEKLKEEKAVKELQAKNQNLKGEIDQLTEARKILNEKIQAVRDTNKALELRIDALDRENASLNANLAKMERDYDSLLSKLGTMRNDSYRLTRNADTVAMENARLREELKFLSDANRELWRKALALGHSLKQILFPAAQAKMMPSKDGWGMVVPAGRTIPLDIIDIYGLGHEIEELQRQLEKLREERSRLENEARWLRRDNELLEKQSVALRQENQRLEQIRKDLEARTRELQQIVNDAEKENRRLKEETSRQAERNRGVEQEIESQQKKNSELGSKIDQELRTMAALRWEIDSKRKENKELTDFALTQVNRLIESAINPQRAPQLASLLAVLAYRFAPFDPDDPARPSIYNALWTALNRLDEKAARELISSPATGRSNKLWTTRSDLIVQKICQRVTHGLSEAEWHQFLPLNAPYTPESSQPCSENGSEKANP